jgi:hypothetical protein
MRLTVKHSDYDRKLAKLNARLTRFPKEAQGATAIGMFAAAQDVMELARSRAPIGPDPSKDHSDRQPGKLRAAAYARYERLMGGASVSVDMGFEGTFSDRGSPQRYMTIQHENMQYEHPQGGQAKFLESAVDDMTQQTKQTIAAYVQAWLRTGKMPGQPAQKVPTQGGG